MANLTRSNVAYDLNISPHYFVIEYQGYQVKYIFSSELYRRKFQEKIIENRKTINQSLSKRFNYTIVCNILCDLKLYSTIEKRGFLIFKDGEKIECPNHITLDGNNLIVKI